MFEANSPGSHSIPGIADNLNVPGFTPDQVLELPNDAQVRTLGQASAGAVGSARGLASMYAAATSEMSGRAPLLEPDTLATFTTLQTTGRDLVRGDRAPYLVGFEAKGCCSAPGRTRLRSFGRGGRRRVRRSAQRSALRVLRAPCRLRHHRA
ncbi:hypothetical protein [Nocardia sp. NPDC051463]|uniref:hypothetical protein n=1 Tax=Nocardia sp. NPDC051463 TaxID=3154845 RepID=UPI003450EA51